MCASASPLDSALLDEYRLPEVSWPVGGISAHEWCGAKQLGGSRTAQLFGGAVFGEVDGSHEPCKGLGGRKAKAI